MHAKFSSVKTSPAAIALLATMDFLATLQGAGNYFAIEQPSLLIVLGDRYEMLGVAEAAGMNAIPILHLHGGEITEGNYDDFIRHCISKISLYHFTSTEVYRQRVIQLGEAPDRVFNMGALGAENCLIHSREHIDQRVTLLANKMYFVVAFHPETASSIEPAAQTMELLAALETVPNNFQLVFIGTNADTQANQIRDAVQRFCACYSYCYMENLDSDSYLELLANARGLIGNSSSGIIEAPTLGTPTVNIGNRQKGRVRADSVIDVPSERKAISRAILQLCRENQPVCGNPYYQPDTAERYYRTTFELLQRSDKTAKSFFDLR